jgi:hypothetical protein
MNNSEVEELGMVVQTKFRNFYTNFQGTSAVFLVCISRLTVNTVAGAVRRLVKGTYNDHVLQLLQPFRFWLGIRGGIRNRKLALRYQQ